MNNFDQVLSTRPRKKVVMSEIKINVCIFAFDILHLNGEPLIQEQLNVRREVFHYLVSSYHLPFKYFDDKY